MDTQQQAPPAPAHDALSHAQPIFLTVESKRDPSYEGDDPIELFNAIHRAFDFEEMEHPFIEVTGGYGARGASYKRICRDLAGCDTNITGYKIGMIAIKCLHGDFVDFGDKKGLVLYVTQTDIFSNVTKYPIEIYVADDADYSNILVAHAKLNLSNNTSVTIEHVPPGAKYEVFFYVEEMLTLPRLLRPGKIEDAKLEYEKFELPQLLKEPTVKNG